MKRPLRLRELLAAAALAAPLAAFAQATSIVADVDPALALGTTVARAGSVYNIDGGRLAGDNLFHSFSQFNLGQGDTARWAPASGAAGIRNVVSRVTGGATSTISGTIDSTALPHASFYFINPAGIVFGAGARLNVPGAAHFSTAGALRFADGQSFAVAAPNGSTLSMATPQSFGFLGGQGAISVTGAAVGFAPAGAQLSLSGSDVSIAGSQIAAQGLDLLAVGQRVTDLALASPLATPANAGAVSVLGSQIVVAPGSATSPLRILGGDVTLNAATVVSDNPTAARGGDLLIQAGQLNIGNGAVIGSNARSSGPGGAVSVTAGAVDGQGALFSTFTSGDGAGGQLSVAADTMTLNSVTMGSNAAGAGAGGDIAVVARTAITGDAFYITANTLGGSQGGQVSLTAPSMDLVNSIANTTASGSGRPGDVALRGAHIALSGGGFGSASGLTGDSGNLTIESSIDLFITSTVLNAATSTAGRAGSISIFSPQARFTQATIDSAAFGDGAVGSVSIRGGTLIFEDNRISADAYGAYADRLGSVEIVATGDVVVRGGFMSSTAYQQARGGTISIQGRTVTLDATQVQTDTVGEGVGGQVNLAAATTLLVDNSTVSSNSNGLGKAGSVTLTADTMTFDTSATISSDSFSAGDGGAVTIKGGKISALNGSSISSTSQTGTGNGGAVSITAGALMVEQATISSDTKTSGKAGDVVINTGDLTMNGGGQAFTYISSDTLGDGNGGRVDITAKSISLDQQAYIASETLANGAGGEVSITTGSLSVRNGSYVSSDTTQFGDFLGAAHAGNVSITADSLLIEGDGDHLTYISSDSLADGDAGSVTLNVKSLKIVRGLVSSDGYFFGEAGDVTVKAGSIAISEGGAIRTDTFGGGDAGDVTVAAGTINLTTGGGIESKAQSGSTGKAGTVRVTADALTVAAKSRVTTSSGSEGAAGAVILNTKALAIDGGEISSAAEVGATGASGALTINAGRVALTKGGIISTVSNNPLIAGQIDIIADSITVDGAGSAISSENQAGAVALGNTAGETGDAGAVNLTAGRVVVSNGGRVTTNAFGGAAGDISIAIERPGLLVLEGATAPGSIQTSSGAGTGGRIAITDPLAILSNGGSILALGQQRGANVTIQSRYFINSTDRANVVAVDGDIRLQTGLYDVSSGIVTRDISVLDASKVLRGQCPSVRATGSVSQLVASPVGPYVRERGFAPAEAPAGGGGCP